MMNKYVLLVEKLIFQGVVFFHHSRYTSIKLDVGTERVTHAKQLSLVTFCDWLQESEKVECDVVRRRTDRREVWNSYLDARVLTISANGELYYWVSTVSLWTLGISATISKLNCTLDSNICSVYGWLVILLSAIYNVL